MVTCDMFLKEFHSRGNDEYLSHWEKEVDWMTAEGWKVIECCRQPEHPGFWIVVFGRATRRFARSGRPKLSHSGFVTCGQVRKTYRTDLTYL